MMERWNVSYIIIWSLNMSYDFYCSTIAFGSPKCVRKFLVVARDLTIDLDVGAHIISTQLDEAHYGIVQHQGSLGRDTEFWDRIIPQFPKLRFLLSRTSEQAHFLTKVVRHRHDPYGFNSCLLDHSTPQALDEFPSTENPISVLDEFYDEALRDASLRHALTLLGYPIEMLVGCSVSAIA
jgi:hypothetical protein